MCPVDKSSLILHGKQSAGELIGLNSLSKTASYAVTASCMW